MSEKVFKPIIPYFLPFRSLCFLIHAPTYDCKEKEKTFKRGLDKLEILLSEIIKKTDDRRKCGCSGSLDSAVKV